MEWTVYKHCNTLYNTANADADVSVHEPQIKSAASACNSLQHTLIHAFVCIKKTRAEAFSQRATFFHVFIHVLVCSTHTHLLNTTICNEGFNVSKLALLRKLHPSFFGDDFQVVIGVL